MTVYRYVAKRSPGERETGTVEAGSAPEALDQLVSRGLAPVRLEPAPDAPGRWRSTVAPTEIAIAFRQMADLLEAGVPLARAVRLTRAQTRRPALAAALTSVERTIEEGRSLSAGLAKTPEIFRPLVLALVRAGEAAGTVAPVLTQIADREERDEETRSRVRAALVYPAFVVVVGLVTSAFLVYYVVPRLAEMLVDSGQALPWPTRLLVGVSDALRRPGRLAAALLGGSAGAAAGRRFFPGFRERLERGAGRLPYWGAIRRHESLARIAGALAALLEGGVPIIDALKHTAALADDADLRGALRTVADRVEQGASLSAAMNETGAFPANLCQMTSVGEEGDGLVPALKNASAAFERSTERSLKVFSSILEPVLILAVGGFTAFLVAALLLPVFEVTAYVR